MEENILENKIREALPRDKITVDANQEIEKLKFFLMRLEKMDPQLAKEFLEIIDNIILKGELEKIILDNQTETKQKNKTK